MRVRLLMRLVPFGVSLMLACGPGSAVDDDRADTGETGGDPIEDLPGDSDDPPDPPDPPDPAPEPVYCDLATIPALSASWKHDLPEHYFDLEATPAGLVGLALDYGNPEQLHLRRLAGDGSTVWSQAFPAAPNDGLAFVQLVQWDGAMLYAKAGDRMVRLDLDGNLDPDWDLVIDLPSDQRISYVDARSDVILATGYEEIDYIEAAHDDDALLWMASKADSLGLYEFHSYGLPVTSESGQYTTKLEDGTVVWSIFAKPDVILGGTDIVVHLDGASHISTARRVDDAVLLLGQTVTQQRIYPWIARYQDNGTQEWLVELETCPADSVFIGATQAVGEDRYWVILRPEIGSDQYGSLLVELDITGVIHRVHAVTGLSTEAWTDLAIVDGAAFISGYGAGPWLARVELD